MREETSSYNDKFMGGRHPSSSGRERCVENTLIQLHFQSGLSLFLLLAGDSAFALDNKRSRILMQ